MQLWDQSNNTVFRVCIFFGYLLKLEDTFDMDKYQQEEQQQDYTLQNSPVEENLCSRFQKERGISSSKQKEIKGQSLQTKSRDLEELIVQDFLTATSHRSEHPQKHFQTRFLTKTTF